MTIVWVLNSEIGTKSSENSMHWLLNHFFMLHLLPLAHKNQCHCEGVLWALRREWLYVPWLDPGWQDPGSHRLQRPVFCLWKDISSVGLTWRKTPNRRVLFWEILSQMAWIILIQSDTGNHKPFRISKHLFVSKKNFRESSWGTYCGDEAVVSLGSKQ